VKLTPREEREKEREEGNGEKKRIRQKGIWNWFTKTKKYYLPIYNTE
jgi:hypothetical protein